MMNTVLAIHIAAGTVALVSMVLPMTARKGGRLHRRAGWAFLGGMVVVSLTAFALSVARFLFDPSPRGRLAGLFLLGVTLITAHGVRAALRVLRSPSRRTARREWMLQHMRTMLGSCIAAVTAFLVNTADNVGIWSPAAWMGPTIVGTPAIVIWTRYYRRKLLSGAHHVEVLGEQRGLGALVGANVAAKLG